jgi:DNA-binding NarL/FixJ family response regulator
MADCSIVAVVTDMIFATRIKAEARALDVPVRVICDSHALDESLRTTPVRLLIVDLNAQGVDTLAAIARARRQDVPPRIVAYLSHVQRALAAQAAAAGAAEVLPRSRFIGVLPELLHTYGKTGIVFKQH